MANAFGGRDIFEIMAGGNRSELKAKQAEMMRQIGVARDKNVADLKSISPDRARGIPDLSATGGTALGATPTVAAPPQTQKVSEAVPTFMKSLAGATSNATPASPSYTGDTSVPENPAFGGGLAPVAASSTAKLGVELPNIGEKVDMPQQWNMNDQNLAALSDMATQAAGKTMKSGSSLTGLSREDLLNRKYDIMAAKTVTDTLQGMTPITSAGQFGIEQMRNNIQQNQLGVERDRNELAKAKVGIESQELGLKGDTLDLARSKEAREGVETAAKVGYYGANAEESLARGRSYDSNAEKPDKIAVEQFKEHEKLWGTNYNERIAPKLEGKNEAEQKKIIDAEKKTFLDANPAPHTRHDLGAGRFELRYPAWTGLKAKRFKPKDAPEEIK